MGDRFYLSCRAIARPIIFLIHRYKFHNKYNMPQSGRVIICSNHISGFDPLCIGIGQKRPIHFMAKKELFEKKPADWFLRKLGSIPVDRDNNDVTAMKAFMRGLKNEEAMGIFIEGTRSKTGDFLEPKEGAALFAYKCSSPVLPVCVTKIGNVEHVRYGDLITVEEMGFNDKSTDKNQKLEYATKYIFDKIKELRKVDLKDAGETG